MHHRQASDGGLNVTNRSVMLDDSLTFGGFLFSNPRDILCCDSLPIPYRTGRMTGAKGMEPVRAAILRPKAMLGLRTRRSPNIANRAGLWDYRDDFVG